MVAMEHRPDPSSIQEYQMNQLIYSALWLLPSFPGSERVIPEKDDALWPMGTDWSQ
jgi:hypothetical protein